MASHELVPESEEFRSHRNNCKVCHHTDRFAIEKSREDGTTLPDLTKKFGLTNSSLKRHFVALREEENRISDQKRVSIREFCESIIRKAQQHLSKSSTNVSVKDALSAATLLTKLGEGEKIDAIWDAIEEGKAQVSSVTKELKITKKVDTISGGEDE